MYHNNVSISICLTWIVFLIIFTSLPIFSSSIDVDQRFADCRPLEAPCGFRIKIAYPFWDSRQQEYCGHPAFKLECADNSSLIINIKNQSYYINSINYEAKVFSISKPLFLSGGACTENQSQLTNTTLDYNLFNFSSDSQIATLFYDCISPKVDEDVRDPPYAFTCATTSFTEPSLTFNSDLGFFAINSAWYEMLRESCNFEISVPILKTSAEDLVNGRSDIDKVLNRGFDVKWIIDKDGHCGDCANSGGRCGFNQTLDEPTCFCEDGAYERSCDSPHVKNTSTGNNTSTSKNTSTGNPHNRKIITIVLVTVGVLTFVIGTLYCLWRWIGPSRYESSRVTGKKTVIKHNIIEASGGEDEYQDFPMLNFEQLAIATNNFQESNKLGQGGFGSVYKGKLENGKEIAVKRLSRSSGQGQQEFMNEVIVISKLQHKNLVKLVGCCAEGEEKLLVYEFLPNKSLNALLFDPIQREVLGWKRRFDMIKGICRGVLYLHRDSRLKIIHRDLKASNILLDEELNPKISDFGMARIFGGKQDQADTLRVVGTYGYMSPEYAMEGRFSEKSDIFSLGVLLLEIVCGRRNGIANDNSLSLIGYAWKLWNENDILSLIDPIISNPCFQVEVLRTLHVELLCVQEVPQDRPDISNVISMLDSEVIDLPRPLQPGFTQSRYCSAASDAQQYSQQNCLINFISISSLHGR